MASSERRTRKINKEIVSYLERIADLNTFSYDYKRSKGGITAFKYKGQDIHISHAATANANYPKNMTSYIRTELRKVGADRKVVADVQFHYLTFETMFEDDQRVALIELFEFLDYLDNEEK